MKPGQLPPSVILTVALLTATAPVVNAAWKLMVLPTPTAAKVPDATMFGFGAVVVVVGATVVVVVGGGVVVVLATVVVVVGAGVVVVAATVVVVVAGFVVVVCATVVVVLGLVVVVAAVVVVVRGTDEVELVGVHFTSWSSSDSLPSSDP